MKKSILVLLTVISQCWFSAVAQITWNMGMNISANTYGNMHPRMALDAAGNPLVIWGRMSDESVFFSRWNGTMFTAPIKLNGMLTVAAATWMGPDIASHGDSVYVVMKQTPEADTSSHIYMVHSYDGGMTFSSPVQVDNIADSVSRFPTVTTDEDGNPIIAFMKFNSLFLDSRWAVTKSPDYGNTFSPDVKASGWGGSAAICDCCPGALVTSGNNCAMLYRNNNINIRDTWMGISNDNGSTFTDGCNIDNNNWLLMSCPSSGPDGIVKGDTLYSVFSSGASGMSLSYISKSSLSAVTWGSTENLSTGIPGLSQQNYPRIARFGNAAGIVWKQVVNGASQLPILFTNDLANGFPAAYDTVDLNDITNTDIAIGNGTVFVIWEDDNSGTVKYRAGTFTPSNTGITELSSNSFSVFPNPASSTFTIQSEKLITGIEITNIYGQKVFSETISAKNKTIDISDLAEGIYFLQLNSAGKTTVQKFIKE